MAIPVCEILLTRQPLAAPPHAELVETGAIVDFWGVVRRAEGEAAIQAIDYEAHPAMAEHQMRTLAVAAAERFALTEARIIHRVGVVAVGEASLFVRVGSRHRAAALHACEWIIDELKKRVPVWKHPRFVADVPGSARMPAIAVEGEPTFA
jgi:molybdopterin synthase catalytic subunit